MYLQNCLNFLHTKLTSGHFVFIFYTVLIFTNEVSVQNQKNLEVQINARVNAEALRRIENITGQTKSHIIRAAILFLDESLSRGTVTVKGEILPTRPRAPSRTGRISVTVRVDENMLTALEHELGLSTTDVINEALDCLHDKKIQAKLPPLIQDEH
jgi:hypothetical protein